MRIKKIVSPKILVIIGIAIVLAGGIFYFALKSGKKISLTSSPQTASTYFKEAQKAESEGDLPKAEELYQKAVEIAGGKNETYLEKLAQVNYRLNDFSDSIANYAKILENRKDSASIYNSIANAYRDSGKTEEAIKNYNQAIELDKTFIVAYANLANLYLLNNDRESAQKIVEQGLENNPKNTELKAMGNKLK